MKIKKCLFLKKETGIFMKRHPGRCRHLFLVPGSIAGYLFRILGPKTYRASFFEGRALLRCLFLDAQRSSAFVTSAGQSNTCENDTGFASPDLVIWTVVAGIGVAADNARVIELLYSRAARHIA